MVKVTITKFTGAGQPIIVSADQKETEPQGSKRPALRLIKNGS